MENPFKNVKVKEFINGTKNFILFLLAAFVFVLIIGVIDYIKIKLNDNDYQQEIEFRDAIIVEKEAVIISLKETVKAEKVATENEKKKRAAAEANRKADLDSYTYYLRVLANSSDKERNDILEEFSNFKYEN